MGGHIRAGHAPFEPARKDDLQTELAHGLVAAGAAESRLGSWAAEERALAFDRPRAVLVFADHAGAGGEQGLAHQVGVVGRHEADQLEGVGGGRRQRRRRLQPQHLGDHVGDAAVRLVEVGVRGDHGDAVPRRAQRQPPGFTVVAQALQRVEDERVVDEQQVAFLAARLVEGGVVHLQRDQHAAHLVARRADLQPHVVPGLGQIERREAVDHRHDIAYLHVRDCNAACTLRLMNDPLDLRPGTGGPALHPWLVVLALAPGIFLTLADATVMTITMQKIIRELGGSVVSVSWVMNGYNLTLTVLFLTMGRLGDRYGHKLVFMLGLALFTAASLPCALATRACTLVAWRVVQALGAAAVVPTALALLLEAFPEGRQGFAAGLFGALSSLAAAAGPVLGGVLVWYWGWPAVFWFNLPVGTLGVILALTLLRSLHTPRTRAALDWPGVAFVSAGLFCLTLAIIQGNEWGWISGAVVGLCVGGGALLAVWIWWELRTTSPLFDLRLFRDRTFAAASTAIMTVDTAMMGTMFMLVIFMIAMMDYSELRAGLAIATLPAAVMVFTPPAGWLTDRIGPRLPAVIGALLSAAGLFALGHMARTDPLSAVLWRSALVGAGIGLSLPAPTRALRQSTPERGSVRAMCPRAKRPAALSRAPLTAGRRGPMRSVSQPAGGVNTITAAGRVAIARPALSSL